MVLEVALLIGGLVTTVAIGAPFATSLVQPHLFGTKRKGGEATRQRRSPTVAFTPLDLGEDPVQWPSANPWSSSDARRQQWPSMAWDDEHFGAHWRDGRLVEAADAGFHAMLERRYDDSTRGAEGVRRANKQPSPNPASERVSSAPEEPTQELVMTADRPPSKDQLEAMIADVGLAATVQAIMEQTGWDFRKAAQYLARARQG